MAKTKKPTKKQALRLSLKKQLEIVAEVAGEDAIPVVEYLKGKENVSEFLIAQDLEEEINAIRNKLYRLLNANLVSFNRKKDKQKGWYIYYWTLNLGQTKFLFYDLKRKKVEKIQERLEREKNNVYFSGPSRAIRLDFDQALSFDFRCPETGELLEQEDNSALLKDLENQIVELQEEIKDIESKRL